MAPPRMSPLLIACLLAAADASPVVPLAGSEPVKLDLAPSLEDPSLRLALDVSAPSATSPSPDRRTAGRLLLLVSAGCAGVAGWYAYETHRIAEGPGDGQAGAWASIGTIASSTAAVVTLATGIWALATAPAPAAPAAAP